MAFTIPSVVNIDNTIPIGTYCCVPSLINTKPGQVSIMWTVAEGKHKDRTFYDNFYYSEKALPRWYTFLQKAFGKDVKVDFLDKVGQVTGVEEMLAMLKTVAPQGYSIDLVINELVNPDTGDTQKSNQPSFAGWNIIRKADA